MWEGQRELKLADEIFLPEHPCQTFSETFCGIPHFKSTDSNQTIFKKSIDFSRKISRIPSQILD